MGRKASVFTLLGIGAIAPPHGRDYWLLEKGNVPIRLCFEIILKAPWVFGAIFFIFYSFFWYELSLLFKVSFGGCKFELVVTYLSEGMPVLNVSSSSSSSDVVLPKMKFSTPNNQLIMFPRHLKRVRCSPLERRKCRHYLRDANSKPKGF